MSQEVESVETTVVFDLAADAVIAATQNGGMIAADVEVRRLLDRHPDCQIPFDELRDAIVRRAVLLGVGIEFGRS